MSDVPFSPSTNLVDPTGEVYTSPSGEPFPGNAGAKRWVISQVFGIHHAILIRVPDNFNWRANGRPDLVQSRYVELHFNIAGPRIAPGFDPTRYNISESINSTDADNIALINAWRRQGGGKDDPVLIPVLYYPVFWDCNSVTSTYETYPNVWWKNSGVAWYPFSPYGSWHW
jgi:hypothetical protein